MGVITQVCGGYNLHVLGIQRGSELSPKRLGDITYVCGQYHMGGSYNLSV